MAQRALTVSARPQTPLSRVGTLLSSLCFSAPTAAPVTTRVLIVTDGSLPSSESTNLSLLFNLALRALSRNGIEDVGEDALHGLPRLRRCCWSTTASPARSSPTARSVGSAANALGTPRGAWFPHTRGA